MDKYRGNLTRDVQEERAARGLPPAAHEAIDNITPQPVQENYVVIDFYISNFVSFWNNFFKRYIQKLN